MDLNLSEIPELGECNDLTEDVWGDKVVDYVTEKAKVNGVEWEWKDFSSALILESAKIRISVKLSKRTRIVFPILIKLFGVVPSLVVIRSSLVIVFRIYLLLVLVGLQIFVGVPLFFPR